MGNLVSTQDEVIQMLESRREATMNLPTPPRWNVPNYNTRNIHYRRVLQLLDEKCGNIRDLRDIIMARIEDALLEDGGLPQVHVVQQPQPQLVPAGENLLFENLFSLKLEILDLKMQLIFKTYLAIFKKTTI